MAKKRPTPKAKAVSPHAAPHIWKPAFLTALALHGNKTLAAEHAGVNRTAIYEARASDPEFAAAWEAAMDEAADRLEAEAWRRARVGVDEPVFGSGGKGVGTVQVGTVRRYSDTLLMFLTKGARPEKFRERFQHQHEGDVKLRLVEEIIDAGSDRATDQAAPGASGVPAE